MIAIPVNPLSEGIQKAPSLTLNNLPDVTQWAADLVKTIHEAINRAQSPNMGALELLLDGALKSLGASYLQSAAQALASQQQMNCVRCQRPLLIESKNRKRNVDSYWGSVEISRRYGYCSFCRDYCFPADDALGLLKRAPFSPRVQEICASMGITMPFGRAEKQSKRLTGLSLSASAIYREALRQGQRAIENREAQVALSKLPGGVEALSKRAKTSDNPFILVIEMDAWNIRERDHWGETQKRRQQKLDLARWHWVYTGTCFRLDQRGKTAGGRAIISERGFVATRQGLDAFRDQLYVETLQRGLTQAQLVLVVADGAVWIWNLVEDRFKDAVQYVDKYHVVEHLWMVANDIYGEGTPEASQWMQPLLGYLERRKDGALDVISHLAGMQEKMKTLTFKQKELLQREIGYFDKNKARMKYKEGKAAGHPIGSGACESTCGQFERRFKCGGQFGSVAGDEALLALDVMERNGRWNLLFPHNNG